MTAAGGGSSQGRRKFLGVYASGKQAASVIRRLKSHGYHEVEAYMPIPDSDVLDALGPARRPVRLFTLAGGILGCLSGFALTIGTSLAWPLRTSAQPIVSIPPFIVIAFELTILFGALATVLGLLLNARLPAWRRSKTYRAEFTNDRFGVLVTCTPDEAPKTGDLLAESSATEVKEIT